jgi:DNA-binding transcriptional LysR family regulator
VAAGAGIALVPESVIATVPAGRHVASHRVASDVARRRTMLAWRAGHRSAALDALRAALAIPSAAARRD